MLKPYDIRGQGVEDMEEAAIACPLGADAQPLSLGRRVLGANACFACHTQGTASYGALDPQVVKIVGAEFLSRAVHDNWVLGNEFVTWGGQDRHAQAFTTLLGERSERMGRIMGIADVSRDVRCLACHASVPAAQMKRDQFTLDASFLGADRVDARIAQGVTCEACHGAAGANLDAGRAGWVDVHVAKESWRDKAPAEKQAEHGFYDVRTPSSRMRMCLSCHMGDVEQGRLVTHAMYAAGHPPLPSFELKAFADMMPPHWRDLGSEATAEPEAAHPDTLRGRKPREITAAFLNATTDPYYRGLRENEREYFDAIVANFSDSFTATRSISVGALVAWSKNAELTGALASDEDFPLLEAEERWPELAQFECSACHHDLRSADWRQQRRHIAPGRPLLRDWSSPLVQAVLGALAPDEAPTFDEHRLQIERAAAAQPFGDMAELAPRLADAEQWLGELARQIEARPFTRIEALGVLRGIAEVGRRELLDYDAARQLTWAFREVLDEIDPERRWTAARNELAALEQLLILDLATVDVRNDREIDTPAGERGAYVIDLAKLLPVAANHSAPAVCAAFDNVAAVVAADPP